MKRLSTQDVYLGILAFLGFLSAIFILPELHPTAAWEESISRQEVRQITERFLKENGYLKGNVDYDIIKSFDKDLLHSLQYNMGRQESMDFLRNGGLERVPAFYWEIGIRREIDDTRRKDYTLRLSTSGDIIDFDNDSVDSGSDGDNEKALASIKEITDRSIGIPPPRSIAPDSIRRALPGRFVNRINDVANFHLERSVIARSAQLDSTSMEGNAIGSADIYYSGQVEGSGHRFKTTMEISAVTGVLHDMRTSFVPITSSEDSAFVDSKFLGINTDGTTWEELSSSLVEIHFFMAIFVLILLGLIFVISFIKRLGAGQIDRKLAFRLAIVCATCAALSNLAQAFGSGEFSSFGSQLTFWLSLAGSLLVAVLVGLLMFVIGGVTHTISREVWPVRLREIDMLWNGQFFNKPIARSIIRGVSVGAALFLLCVVFLWITDAPIFLGESQSFLFHKNPKPALIQVFATNIWTSYLIASVLFLGGLAFFHRKKNGTIRFYLIAALFSMLLANAPLQVSGIFANISLVTLSGLVLAWSFKNHGFLVSYLGLASWYLIWMSRSQSIAVGGLPVVFLIAIGILTTLLCLAFIGLRSEKDHDDIRAYKPAYLDEEEKKQRMFRELEIAREVQNSFLPQEMPSIPGLQVAAICEAATEVGGDYFDLINLDDGKFAMVIGDVSGKGIQAAFYMTLVKGFIRSLCEITQSPAELLRRANSLFFENSERGTFISMIYGVLDTKAQTLKFARAGHNPLLLKRSPSQIAEVIQPAGMGMGLVKGPGFDESIEEVSISLRQGDVLVFYTDGFSEAMNSKNHLYSDERLTEFVSANGHYSAAEILERTLGDVREFVADAEQHDDMTMIVVKLDEAPSDR